MEKNNWPEDNRFADPMPREVEALFATLTAVERARAYSVFRLRCEVDFVIEADDLPFYMMEAIRQTICERGNPQPPETPESIKRFMAELMVIEWSDDNRYADPMRDDVEALFVTLTADEQARAYSLFKLHCELCGYRGLAGQAEDMLSAIERTIGERGNPQPALMPASIARIRDAEVREQASWSGNVAYIPGNMTN
jgi:hypothetical protein